MTLNGGDLYVDRGGGSVRDSIVVDDDGANNQIRAVGNISLLRKADGPSAADILINGKLTATGTGSGHRHGLLRPRVRG